MHFGLKKAATVIAVPLLGGGVAAGAAALPASAATWQDTAFAVTFTGATYASPAAPVVANPGGRITVTPYAFGYKLTVNTARSSIPRGVVVRQPVAGGTVTLSERSPAPATTRTGTLVVDEAHGKAAMADIVAFTANPSGTVTLNYNYTDTPGVISRSYVGGGVQFHEAFVLKATYPSTPAPRLSPLPHYGFAYSGLPGGIVSGSNGKLTIAGSTAAPGTYGGLAVTAADQYGAYTGRVFSLKVSARQVYVPGSYGDEVNPFGNGFDVYQQHQAVNAIIAGWTATKADPATHFLREPGTRPGAYRFEYAPYGAGTGLYVADPGYDAAGTGLKDGLVLRGGNNGPWQQWYPQANGTLKNAATGLIVSPDGTGAQLRGTVAPTPWGGSVYRWTDYAHLPR